MTPKEVSKELRLVQEKYKDKPTDSFSIRISDMARDSADAIDSLQTFVDHIGCQTTCNTCRSKQCIYRPTLGDAVRYNCPLYISLSKKGEK